MSIEISRIHIKEMEFFRCRGCQTMRRKQTIYRWQSWMGEKERGHTYCTACAKKWMRRVREDHGRAIRQKWSKVYQKRDWQTQEEYQKAYTRAFWKWCRENNVKFEPRKHRLHHCYLCHRYLPWYDFYRDRSRHGGVGSRCKLCDNQRSEERKNPVKQQYSSSPNAHARPGRKWGWREQSRYDPRPTWTEDDAR